MNETTGKDLKEQALDQLETRHQDWLTFMRGTARRIAQLQGSVTTDDLHEVAELYNHHPANAKAYGAIFRGPEWKATGYRKTTRPAAHARPIRVWELAQPAAAITLAEPFKAPAAKVSEAGDLEDMNPSQGALAL